MHIFYRLVVLLGGISATVAAVILPMPTTKDPSNNKTLSVTGGIGIHCRGSSRCSGTASAQYLAQFINELPDDVFYSNQQQIACIGTICAFLQSTDGRLSQDIKTIAHYIPEYGCLSCGSVPVHYPESNNVMNGELTFDYAEHRCRNSGLCPYWYYATHTPILTLPDPVCQIVPMFIGGVVSGMAIAGFMALMGFYWTWRHREGWDQREREPLLGPNKTRR